MPLVPVSGLTPPSSSQKKAIRTEVDKSGKTLMDLFLSKLTPVRDPNVVSIGSREKAPKPIVSLGAYRIDLQKYNTNGSANFAIQTNGSNSVTLAALFMPPDTDFTHQAVSNGFDASLDSAGVSAYQL